MKKAIISSILAASLIIAALPATEVSAKAKIINYAAPINISAEASTDACFSYFDSSAKSEDYTLSMEVYYPKTAIAENTAYGIETYIDVFGFEATADGSPVYNEEGGLNTYPGALGSAKTTFTLSGNTFTFGGISDADKYLSMTPVGSYYLLKIKKLPVKLSQYAGGGISKYDNLPADVLVFPDFVFTGKPAAASKIYLDNVSVRTAKEEAFDNDFDENPEDSLFETVGKGEEKSVKLKRFTAGKLSVKKEKVTLKVKKKVNLGAVADPTDKITYFSANKKVATVNSKGVVTAKKKGKAKIYVYANGYELLVNVTVK